MPASAIALPPSVVHLEREELAASKALMRAAQLCPDQRLPLEQVDAALGSRRLTSGCSIKVTGDASRYRWSCSCGTGTPKQYPSLDEAEAAALQHVAGD